MPIHYIPPSDDTIRSFVRQMSERIAEKRTDTHYKNPKVYVGMIQCLKILAEIQASHLNRQCQSEGSIP
jgi:hypothetical protein